MKKFLIPLAVFGFMGMSAPLATPADAQGISVQIGDRDRGNHRGWNRGRHHGWHNSNRRHRAHRGEHRNRVIILKRDHRQSNWR